MPSAAAPGDDAPIHAHVTTDKLQLLMGWDLTVLRQLWGRGVFPKRVDTSAAEPVWRAHHVLDWLHVRSASQAEAARNIRQHHVGIYERSLKKSEAERQDVEYTRNAAASGVKALLKALDGGAELTLYRPRREEEAHDEPDSWGILLTHWKVVHYCSFQMVELRLQRALETIDDLREEGGELVAKGSSFQPAFERLHVAAEEYRSASEALERELAHLNALNNGALTVFGLSPRNAEAEAKAILREATR